LNNAHLYNPVYNTCAKVNETNPLDYGNKPASNPGAPLLKSKQPYPKQFSKGRVLRQQLPQKMLQLLSDTKMIPMSLANKLPRRN